MRLAVVITGWRCDEQSQYLDKILAHLPNVHRNWAHDGEFTERHQ